MKMCEGKTFQFYLLVGSDDDDGLLVIKVLCLDSTQAKQIFNWNKYQAISILTEKGFRIHLTQTGMGVEINLASHDPLTRIHARYHDLVVIHHSMAYRLSFQCQWTQRQQQPQEPMIITDLLINFSGVHLFGSQGIIMNGEKLTQRPMKTEVLLPQIERPKIKGKRYLWGNFTEFHVNSVIAHITMESFLDHLMLTPANWKILIGSDSQRPIQIELTEDLILTLVDFLKGHYVFDHFVLTLPKMSVSKISDNFVFEGYLCDSQILNELIFPREEPLNDEALFDQLKEICPDPDLVQGYIKAILVYLITNHLLIGSEYLETTLLKHILIHHIQKYVDNVKSYQAVNICHFEKSHGLSRNLIEKSLPANPESSSIVIMNHEGQMIPYPDTFRLILDTGNSVTTYIGHDVVTFLGLKPQQFCSVVSHGVGGGILECHEYVYLSFAMQRFPQRIYRVLSFVRYEEPKTLLLGQNSGLDLLFADGYTIKGKYAPHSQKKLMELKLKESQHKIIQILQGKYRSFIQKPPELSLILSQPLMIPLFLTLLDFLSEHLLLLNQYYTETDMETLSILWKWLNQIKIEITHVQTHDPSYPPVMDQIKKKIDLIYQEDTQH